MYWILDIALVLGGYVLSIYTWPNIRLMVNGAELEAAKLTNKARALQSAIKG